jgi:hypothetical protein
MTLKVKELKSDKSGLSTALIAVIVIVIIVVAAAGVYLVLSGDDEEKEPGQELAPGTVMYFDAEGDATIDVVKMEFIGQNADSYVVERTFGTKTSTHIEYGMLPKVSGSNANIGLVGTEVIEYDGEKITVNVYEYADDEGIPVKAYVDRSNGLLYKYEITDPEYKMTATLTESELVLQDVGSYKESDAIGKEYNFARRDVSINFHFLMVECIADCLDGQYGVMIADEFFLSAYPQGLPILAERSDMVVTQDTIDGELELEVWVYENDATGGAWEFYFDPVSNNIYTIINIDFSFKGVPYDLTAPK